MGEGGIKNGQKHSDVFYGQTPMLNKFLLPKLISKEKTVMICGRLFVCNRGDTYYSISAGSKKGSLAKLISLLFLTPRPALSSRQHRTFAISLCTGPCVYPRKELTKYKADRKVSISTVTIIQVILKTNKCFKIPNISKRGTPGTIISK